MDSIAKNNLLKNIYDFVKKNKTFPQTFFRKLTLHLQK